MHRNGHVGRNVADRGIDHVGIDHGQLIGIIAARRHLRPQRRIAQIGQIDLVELQIAAAGIRERTHHFGVALPEVAVEILHRRIDRFRHRVAPVAEVQRRGRRDGHLRGDLGVRGYELEMLDHRMTPEGAELVLEPQQDGPRLRPLEQHLALAVIGLDAVEPEQEIGLPGGAAELAIGDGFEPDRLLLGDHRGDLAVLDGGELRGADLAALMPGARLLEGRRPQQAAHMIGAKRGLGSLHGKTLVQNGQWRTGDSECRYPQELCKHPKGRRWDDGPWAVRYLIPPAPLRGEGVKCSAT